MSTKLPLTKFFRYSETFVFQRSPHLPQSPEMSGGFVEITVLPSKFQKELDSLKGLVDDAPIKVLPVEGFSLGGIFVALQKWERKEISNLLKVEPLYFRPPV